MSTVAISYGSIGDASKEAKDVAKKLEKYADSLYNSIYKKLDRYGGPLSENISSAKSALSRKSDQLRTEADKYEAYAASLTGLREECKRVDSAVHSKVSQLTAQFKQNHGIRNSCVENTINYFCTGLVNSTSAGRWLSGKFDQVEAGKSYLKESIKEWYNYGGGKEWIKGSLVAIAEVALGVLAIVGAIAAFMTGGALLVMIAGVVGGIIAVANGVTNFVNEQRAYSYTQNNDPATGRRKSDLNTLTDTIRTESDDKTLHAVAMGIDIVNFACTVVTVVSSGMDIVKKGYKWLTGGSGKFSDLKRLFSIDSLKSFGSSLKTKVMQGFGDIKIAVKSGFQSGNWDKMKQFGQTLSKSFVGNLKDEYWDFKAMKNGGKWDLKAIKNNIGLLKNIIGAGKDLVSEDFDFKNLVKFSYEKILVPGVTNSTMFTIDNKDVSYSDVIGLKDKWGKLHKGVMGVFDNISAEFEFSGIGDVMGKLSTPKNININFDFNVNVNLPDISLSVLRVA